ncbi:MAG TPA: ECF transporter S component [Candidatus Atribacteria bacterium]|nr:ECF transporter S component [Candidatus Atribacteria bacterium]HPT78342.1 ECF transporter S component [Candidatus Atribacteria bacterium]
MNKTVRFLTRTAVLLALTVLFQALRTHQFVTGSLVNLCLILSTVLVGLASGITISAAAPLFAYLLGFLPHPWMVLFVALGNMALVLIIHLLYSKNTYLAVGAGAVLKFLVLFISVTKLAIPMLLAGELPEKKLAVLSVNFSWPQLVTALIGGALALAVIPLIRKAIKE